MARARRLEGANPNEHPKERLDRELGELLEEIRVLLPGIEILFGFLIILPFSEGFGRVSGYERGVYLASLLATACGLALCVAPTTYHRLRFREGDKEHLLFAANRMVIAASVLIALGIVLSVYLVVQAIVPGAWAAAIAVGMAAWFAGLWFGLPLFRRARDRE
jgi:hypothetical protein